MAEAAAAVGGHPPASGLPVAGERDWVRGAERRDNLSQRSAPSPSRGAFVCRTPGEGGDGALSCMGDNAGGRGIGGRTRRRGCSSPSRTCGGNRLRDDWSWSGVRAEAPPITFLSLNLRTELYFHH